MKAPANFSENQRLYTITQLETQYQAEPYQRSVQRDGIAWLWQGVKGAIAAMAGNMEPRIRQVRNGDGHLRWRAYDPVSGQVAYLASESELRHWLEQRYYR